MSHWGYVIEQLIQVDEESIQQQRRQSQPAVPAGRPKAAAPVSRSGRGWLPTRWQQARRSLTRQFGRSLG